MELRKIKGMFIWIKWVYKLNRRLNTMEGNIKEKITAQKETLSQHRDS